MIVDDEPSNLILLRSMLERAGLKNIICLDDPCDAIMSFVQQPPDLLLLDLSMPKIDGFEVLSQVRSIVPEGIYLPVPVLIITGDRAEETKERALACGAHDFVSKPFNPREVVLRVCNLLQARFYHLQMEENNHRLEEAVKARTQELSNALEELRDVQGQVIQQEKLRALGTMASGVVHDVNNALSVILGLGEFVMKDCEKMLGMQVSVSRMKSILTAADDAGRMAKRLSYFYRKTPPDTDCFLDLNAVIRETLSLTEPRWKTQPMERGIHIDLNLALKELPPIVGHPSELRETITNLIFNAVDAMPEGGVLSLKTSAEPEEVVLQIGDTGTGMREEVRLRCLEPFFSTKGEHGTGLGLSMVYGIVQRHGGTMDIATEAGRGTTFNLRFPRDRKIEPRPLPQPTVQFNGTLRILVVEDHDVFRDILVQSLKEDSHMVASAANARDAIHLLETANFDLLLTDHGMPGMNGEQLIAYVRKTRPEMRTLLLTSFGQSDEESLAAVDLAVTKPLSTAKLREAIAAAMEPKPTTPHRVTVLPAPSKELAAPAKKPVFAS